MMKKILLFLAIFIFSCKGYWVQGGAAVDKDIGRQPLSSGKSAVHKTVSLSDEDVSIYMGVQAALSGGDVVTAQSLINKLIERHPRYIGHYIDLINIHIFKKNLEEAKEAINKALSIEPDNVDVLLSSANIHMMKGQHKTAAPILERVIKLSGGKDSVYLILANIYFQEKEYAKAKDVLEKLAGLSPDNILVHLYLGKVHESLNMNKEAAVYYERAFKVRGEDEILISLDNIYDKLGDRSKSIEALERFLSGNPDFPKVRERLALLYLGDNNYEKSMEHFDALLSDYPDNIELKFKAVYVAIDGGFFDKAKSYLEEITRRDPQGQKGIYYSGLLYKELKDWKKAAEYFEKVSDEEYFKSANLYLAASYAKLDQKEKALKILERLWGDDKDEETGYFLAVYYKGWKEFDKALSVLGELTMNPNLKGNKAIYLTAEIYLKKGEFQKGIAMVEEILKNNPDDPEALNFIGYSYAERGLHMDRAEEMLKRAIALKPDDPYIMDSVAWLYYIKKDYSKALEWQTKAVGKLKNEATLLEHMGDILKALGKNKEAREYYIDALKYDPEEPEALNKKVEELKDH